MKLGAVFPQTEIGNDPAHIRDFAQGVEGLGFDYLLAYEHVLGANPERPGGWQGAYTYRDAFHEPFVLFGYLAGLTERLEFATSVLVLPQRQTTVVAKQAATLDVLSGGRLRLGVGIGWNRVEFEALGYAFANRGRRIEEQVLVLRELWTKPLVTFVGQYHTIDDAGINPLPVQRPIPIWFGGMAEAVLRRTARLGDGWMPRPLPPEEGEPLVERLRDYLEAAGRDAQDFGIDVRINMQQMPRSAWGAYAEGWRRLGATHICLNTMGVGLSTLEARLEALRQFQEVVGG